MSTGQQEMGDEESQPQLFKCWNYSKCGAERDAEHLFLPDLRQLAKDKAASSRYQGVNHVTPEELPHVASCEQCRFEDEIYTLAQSMASARRYQERRQFVRGEAPRSDSEVTTCFCCAKRGKVRTIPWSMAQAPGWTGCNILRMIRLGLTDLSNKRACYVSADDLREQGAEGFVACPECMKFLIPHLEKEARKLGVTEDTIARRIPPRSVLGMIAEVERAVARRQSSRGEPTTAGVSAAAV